MESLAPLAIKQARSIALVGAEETVFVKGNRHALEVALRNLIENAIVHTPQHTEVLVEVSRAAANVSVSDHGPGVRLDDAERLFDRFWRGKGSPGTGAGLGLAIVKEIMDAHGGKVGVANNPRGGARFTMQFPVPKQE